MAKFKDLREAAESKPAAVLPPGRPWLRLEPVRMSSGARAYVLQRLTQNADGTFGVEVLHDADVPALAAALLTREAL